MDQDTYHNQIFGVLSSFRGKITLNFDFKANIYIKNFFQAKPLDKIENHLLRTVDEPLQDSIRVTLSDQLNLLVEENLVTRNKNGYRLNPFHPAHSQGMPNVDQLRNLPSQVVIIKSFIMKLIIYTKNFDY